MRKFCLSCLQPPPPAPTKRFVPYVRSDVLLNRRMTFEHVPRERHSHKRQPQGDQEPEMAKRARAREEGLLPEGEGEESEESAAEVAKPGEKRAESPEKGGENGMGDGSKTKRVHISFPEEGGDEKGGENETEKKGGGCGAGTRESFPAKEKQGLVVKDQQKDAGKATPGLRELTTPQPTWIDKPANQNQPVQRTRKTEDVSSGDSGKGAGVLLTGVEKRLLLEAKQGGNRRPGSRGNLSEQRLRKLPPPEGREAPAKPAVSGNRS
jgi:hypothetical protein